MEYLKPHLPLDKQAQQLIDRGLVANKEELVKRLSSVSYYRLSGYLYPFRTPGTDCYREGTTLEMVWNRYCFDRRLRVLLLDAIERIEVAVRTQLVYHFSEAHGAFGHCQEENLPNLKDISKYIEWRQALIIETSRSKEPFKKHFSEKYGTTHRNLPIWMVCELMSMGSMFTFYNGASKAIQGKVAAHFAMPEEQLMSWLRSLYAVRNICAHHSRLWNRVLGNAPGLPNRNKFPEWHQEDENGKKLFTNNRCGITLMICHSFLSQISPSSRWGNRIEQLFAEYPEIPISDMGLPKDWQKSLLWTQ